MILLFQSSFRLSEKNEKDKKRKELTPVSATPFRGGFATLNPPLGHAKVREGKSFFMILLFQSSFRLSEKNEKDKKRKVFLF